MNRNLKDRIDRLTRHQPPPPVSLLAILEAGSGAIDAAFRDGSLRAALDTLSPGELQALAETLEGDA